MSLLLLALLLAAPQSERSSLSAEIDRALHWLRAQQAEDGGYGGSVETTAWVLHAFAASPRAYKASDGPFLSRALSWLVARQDGEGAIADAEVPPATRRAQTLRAAAVLDELGTAPAALERARVYLGPDTRIRASEVFAPQHAEASEELLESLLARRAPDGSLDGDPRATAELALVLSFAHAARAAPTSAPRAARPLPPLSAADQARVERAIAEGTRFLVSRADAGRFGPPGEPDAGITAMAVGALLVAPEPRPEAVQRAIDQGLAWLRTVQREDGSFTQGGLANYVTSATILALARAGLEGDRERIARARDFLVRLQADEGEHYSPDDPHYGGIGYGNDERPDLSNLQMALEALAASGLPREHEAFARALRFLERCQNRSESNDLVVRDGDVIVRSGDDGGAAYAPGASEAGFVELEGGVKVPRSYGSMTYALLKSYVLSGLRRDDPRVQAAWSWIARNWTLDVNPGFERSSDPRAAYQGLFYYFLTMARALEAYGEEQVVDPEGAAHTWREQLAARLVALQSKRDGSWINENSARWWEGDPVLATSYALLALDVVRPR